MKARAKMPGMPQQNGPGAPQPHQSVNRSHSASISAGKRGSVVANCGQTSTRSAKDETECCANGAAPPGPSPIRGPRTSGLLSNGGTKNLPDVGEQFHELSTITLGIGLSEEITQGFQEGISLAVEPAG